jgi:UDP-glucose 4-epimerase
MILDLMQPQNERNIKHLLNHSQVTIFRGDVLDKLLMDKLISDSDIVFHLAAVVGVEHYIARPYDVLNVNINGTKLVLDLAYKYDKKVVFASTSEIYGKATDVPFREEGDRVLGATRIDRWCYSTSKAAAEHFCFAYHQQGLPVVILRFFNAYGPRLDSVESGRVISIFIGQLLQGKPITVVGDGSQTRCFTYVEDIVDGIIRANREERAVGEVFNLGTDKETPIIDLAELIVELFGSAGQITFVASEGIYGLSYEDIQRRAPDISKARAVLGFEPTVSLRDGLANTITWFKENFSERA